MAFDAQWPDVANHPPERLDPESSIHGHHPWAGEVVTELGAVGGDSGEASALESQGRTQRAMPVTDAEVTEYPRVLLATCDRHPPRESARDAHYPSRIRRDPESTLPVGVLPIDPVEPGVVVVWVQVTRERVQRQLAVGIEVAVSND